jgi:amino acid transporter
LQNQVTFERNITVLTALNYSELGAAIPLAGGGYSFTSRTLPRPLAFGTGWFFWIGNTLACGMYALVFALTIRAYFLPEVSIALLALLTTVVFTAVNFRGMSEAIKIITVMNLVELAVLVAVPLLGIKDIDPGKTVPRAILITLGIATAIYVFVVGIMFAVVPHGQLAGSEVPFIFVSERILGGWGRWAAIVATIMASLSAFSVTLGASARVLFALSRDGHFPRVFARLHPKYQTPHVALLSCAVMVVVFSASGILRFVATLVNEHPARGPSDLRRTGVRHQESPGDLHPAAMTNPAGWVGRLRLFPLQDLDRIQVGRPASRQIAGRQGGGKQQHPCRSQRGRIPGLDSEELALHDPAQSDG